MDRDSFDSLVTTSRLDEFANDIGRGKNLLIEEIWEGPKAHLLALLQKATQKHLLIITPERGEDQFFSDLSFFTKTSSIEFPAWETLPQENLSPSSDVIGERFEALKELSLATTPQVVITSIKALFEKVVSPHFFSQLFLKIEKGSTLGFEAFQDQLANLGYHRAPTTLEKGTFAVRGGIIDLFATNSSAPFRIEFFEDRVASIRTFDPSTQISTGKVDSITLTPNNEFRFIEKKESEGSLFDYLGDQVVLVFDDPFALEENYVQSSLGIEHPHLINKATFFSLIDGFQKIFFLPDALDQHVEPTILEKGGYSARSKGGYLRFSIFDHSFDAHRFRHPYMPLHASFCPENVALDTFSDDQFLEEILKAPVTLCFLTPEHSDEQFISDKIQNLEKNASIHWYKGYLTSGFFLPETQFALIPARELTHRLQVKRVRMRAYQHSAPQDIFSYAPGEAVVHMNSGIGRYVGIERRSNHLGIESEFLVLEYAEDSKLYVPIEQSNLISKYIGATTDPPQLHLLGSNRWKKALEKSETAILAYADDLLLLEAERTHRVGFAYPEESELVFQFADEFPYVETPDQLTAIEQVFKDMKTAKPMDRLICGDVGYGKTEVAMRAAFKAVVDGHKQVAVLVPTTVLAAQHYESFTSRMKGFPIRVGILSRFQSAKEIRTTIEGLFDGTIDIVIGTHRLISKDVLFANLGLIIIDEEQRFGVKAKDHLKMLKKDVDCLTLSATPIPRTLYSSLVGTREMSVINTPPLDRLPIQTIVCEAQDELMKSALLRELMRDGQAFVIHNRIQTIYDLSAKIRELLPEAKIVVAHGDMSADDLDAIFTAFKTGKADILISTSIIENGIDIPNANTILVDGANHFGLADLYQMRGRVGRWNRKAFCYFMVRNLHTLSEVSKRRLSAIASGPGYGGGMKIALHDLEIRGAGNILGTEQSGHITSIGFNLYCKLLKKAVNKLKKKEKPQILTEVKIDFPFDARLPEHYVPETSLRLEFYGRLGEVESEQEILDLQAELIDRFGALPPPVEWLFAIAFIRLFAAQNQFSLLQLRKVTLQAEQTVGPSKKIIKTILLAPIKTPKELQEKIIGSLIENFPLPT